MVAVLPSPKTSGCVAAVAVDGRGVVVTEAERMARLLSPLTRAVLLLAVGRGRRAVVTVDQGGVAVAVGRGRCAAVAADNCQVVVAAGRRGGAVARQRRSPANPGRPRMMSRCLAAASHR